MTVANYMARKAKRAGRTYVNKAKKYAQSVKARRRYIGGRHASTGAGAIGDTIGSLSRRTHDPFPATMAVKMYYMDSFSITAGNATSSENIYRLNSLFKPDLTNTGHQPYGFDTMQAIYYNYMVLGTLVELEWFDPSVDGILALYQVHGNAISGFAANVLGERPWCDMADLQNTGSQHHKFRIYIDCAKALGLNRMQYKCDTDNMGALTTASPTTQPYLRVGAISTNGSTATIKLNIRLTFFCKFWNRVTLGQSS